MTIALGFLCYNGVVLCADSLESDGFTKHYVNKIQLSMHPRQKWGLAVAGAGDSAVFNTFVDRLRLSIADDEFDQEKLENKIGAVYKYARERYTNTPFRVLVALYGFNEKMRGDREYIEELKKSGVKGTWESALYRDNNENCLERISTDPSFAAIGLASSLSAMFLKTLADWRMSVDEAAALGVHIIALAKEHVDGCGGHTNLVIQRLGSDGFERQYKPDPMSQANLGKLESSQLRDFAENINSYWKAQNRKRGLPRRYQSPFDKRMKAQRRKKV